MPKPIILNLDLDIDSNMKKIVPILLLFLPLFFSGCEPVCDCFKGEGSLTTEERTLPEIDIVEVRNDVDVIVHIDSIYRMRVTAGSKLIDEITTTIDGKTLTIKNKNNCNWIRKFQPVLQVEIWVPSLSQINYHDATGNLEMLDTLKVPEFLFQSFASSGNYKLKINAGTATFTIHNGPSDLYAEGKVNVVYDYNAGFGVMDCLNIVSDDTYLNNKGTNDMYVQANKVLGVTIEGTGNVYYTGHPQNLTTNITGGGKLIPLQ
ncbi:hypothetical protein BH11BAC2_BH11BAC2_21470 [soil metagenome]